MRNINVYIKVLLLSLSPLFCFGEDALSVIISEANNAECNNGAIDLKIEGSIGLVCVEWSGVGGYSSFSYEIDGIDGQEDRSNLESGMYSVIVTDQLCRVAVLNDINVMCCDVKLLEDTIQTTFNNGYADVSQNEYATIGSKGMSSDLQSIHKLEHENAANENTDQQDLIDELAFELKYDKWDEIKSNIKDINSFCEISHDSLGYRINVNKVLETLMEIEESKSFQSIDELIVLQNEFVKYLENYWKFYDDLNRIQNCAYLRDHYDIVIGLEFTIKSLKLNSHKSDPEYIFSEYKKVRNYWLYVLAPPKDGITRIKSKLIFDHPFLREWSGRFYGRRINVGIITPYLDLVEDYIVEELKKYIYEYKDDKINNGYFKYKLRFTKEIIVKSNSKKVVDVIVQNKDVFLKDRNYSNPMFVFLPSLSKESPKFLIDILFDSGVFNEYNKIKINWNYALIFTNFWWYYPDRSHNETSARKYLEKKLKSKIQKTNTIGKISEVLGGYYKDEEMLKVLLSINEYLDKDEDKKKLLVLLKPYTPLVKNYARTVRKMYNRTIKSLILIP